LAPDVGGLVDKGRSERDRKEKLGRGGAGILVEKRPMRSGTQAERVGIDLKKKKSLKKGDSGKSLRAG